MAHFLLLVGGHAQMTGDLCPKCGAVHVALTKRGQPCCQKHRKSVNVQCGAPALVGTDACRLHCGGKAQARAKGRANIARQTAEADLAKLGIPIQAGHYEILEQSLWEANGNVAYLRSLVGTLEDLHQTDSGPGGSAKNVPHVLVDLYGEWIDRLTRIAKDCAALGLDERRLRVDEAQIAALGEAVTRALRVLPRESQEAFRVALAVELRSIAGGLRRTPSQLPDTAA